MLGPPLQRPLISNPDGPTDGWWTRTVDGPGMVVPDGAIDLMWSPGRTPWLAGPDRGPREVVMHPGSLVVGVRLRVGAAAALIGGSVELVTDQRVALDDIRSAPTTRRLVDALGDSPSPVTAAGLLDEFVTAIVGNEWRPDPVVLRTIASLRAGLGVPDVRLSARQHRRRFAQAMGYGPKLYERICRLDRFTESMGDEPLASLATRLGYSDQAHLTRDCVALTGSTPARLRAAA